MMHIMAATPKHREQFRVLLHDGMHSRRAGQAANAPTNRRIPLGTKSSASAPASLLETHCSINSGRSWYGCGLATCIEKN